MKTIKNVFLGCLIFISVALLNSCATIINGTKTKITFVSEPPGADIFIIKRKAEIKVGTTPGIAKIPNNTRMIIFKKEGFYDEQYYIAEDAEMNLWYLGNLLTFSFPGMIVDLITGGYINLPMSAKVYLNKKCIN